MTKKQINTVTTVIIIAVIAVLFYLIYTETQKLKVLRLRAIELQNKAKNGTITEPEKVELNTILAQLAKSKLSLYPTKIGTVVFSNATQQIAQLGYKQGYNAYNSPTPGKDALEPKTYPTVTDGDTLGVIIDKDDLYVYTKLEGNGSSFSTDTYYRVYPSQLKK